MAVPFAAKHKQAPPSSDRMPQLAFCRLCNPWPTISSRCSSALAGQATALVQMGCELADALWQAGRRAIELLLDQAARAEPTAGACARGGPTHPEGFEPNSFVMRFGP